MKDTQTSLFPNLGLSELEKSWENHGNLPLEQLIEIAEQNFSEGIYAVALFLANKILKTKNPDAKTVERLRYIRGECYYQFKYYRQAYPDFVFYRKQTGSSPELDSKISECRRAIHIGNIGSVLFIGVFGLSIVIMYWALYQIREEFPMGLTLEGIYYSGAFFAFLILFGLFYRYVVVPRIK
jgi:hypothetical protein